MPAMKVADCQSRAIAVILVGASVLWLLPQLHIHLVSSPNRLAWSAAFHSGLTVSNSARHVLSTASEHNPSISFVTLSFNHTRGDDHDIIDHNCAVIHSHGLQLHIFTDNLTQPACSSSSTSCTCHRFQEPVCSCPYSLLNERCFCTKLLFLRDILVNPLPTFDEFVFIDADLIIVKPELFIPALLARTKHFDFLSPYAYQELSNWRYTNQFNSGLFFIRRNKSVDYNGLIDEWKRLGSSNDQIVLSSFVRKNVRNWDTLSLKWHCRHLNRREHNIPISDCYTHHSKRLLRQALFDSGFKLLRSVKSHSIR